jgi:hypothetical protein
LIRGEENSFLRVDFIAKDNDEKDVILHLNDFSQPIDSEFQWLHFNFSFLKDPTSKLLFSRIRSFYFYINPGEKAQGEVELLAFFAGSEQNFFYQLNRIKL